MERNQWRVCFPGSGFNVWLSWDETPTHYLLRHASGFQFLHIPKWAMRVTPAGWALSGDVRWNSSERLYAYCSTLTNFSPSASN
jgi:hypothetical protein